MTTETTPNQMIGRGKNKPEAIVIHITEGSASGAIAWFKNIKSQVSAHYIVKKTGEIVQVVSPDNTAWHAGIIKNPTWPLLKQGVNPNLYTIGIENEGFTTEKPTITQFLALAKLVKSLCVKYDISIDKNHIVAHHEIRSDKSCPGPYFKTDIIAFLANLND